MTIETTIRRLIERSQVARVEITSRDGKTYTATAYPASWHPIIKQRREAAFAAKPEWTIPEATEVENNARDQPLCQGSGPTIEDAVTVLVSPVKNLL